MAQEAPADDEDCNTQRPTPQEEAKGERLVVRFDGKGVPMIEAEAVKLKPSWARASSGRSKRTHWWGSATPSLPKPRSPEALAERLVEPAAARARRQREARHGR